jgi:hypothetical protein
MSTPSTTPGSQEERGSAACHDARADTRRRRWQHGTSPYREASHRGISPILLLPNMLPKSSDSLRAVWLRSNCWPLPSPARAMTANPSPLEGARMPGGCSTHACLVWASRAARRACVPGCGSHNSPVPSGWPVFLVGTEPRRHARAPLGLWRQRDQLRGIVLATATRIPAGSDGHELGAEIDRPGHVLLDREPVHRNWGGSVHQKSVHQKSDAPVDFGITADRVITRCRILATLDPSAPACGFLDRFAATCPAGSGWGRACL